MSEKQLHKTLDTRGDRLSGLTKEIGRGFDEDTIHDFRTTLKKWRTLLRAFSQKKRPLTRPFKLLVGMSGEIRNAQVLLKDLDPHDRRLDGFRDWLSDLLAARENAWKEAYDPATIHHQLRKTARADYKQHAPRRIEQFCRKKINRIKGILCLTPPSNDDLHSARKMIKDMEYLIEWADKQGAGSRLTGELDDLKKIAKQAGDFNDKRLALDLLDDYIRDSGPAEPQLTTVRSEWEESVAKKKRALVNALQRYVHGT